MSFAATSANTTYALPSNGYPQPTSVDPRMTIRNPSGPGSANFAPPSSSINRSEESTRAPTMQYVDVGTPHYASAPNYNSVVFRSRSDADPSSPSRGISIPSFFEEGLVERIEAPDDTPFALTPLGEANSVELEFHWPGYLRYSVQVTIGCRVTRDGRFVRHHISRSALGQAIARHAIRFARMAQWETNVPPPVPFGATSAPGVTTNEMLLRSLDPMISPEGRVVWVPHFAIRYPLGEGHVRHTCQRTRW